MLKNLPNEALDFVVEMIQEFWQQKIDFKAWHVTKLNILYKGKGDQQDLNNYRGICLKESCTKIISAIVANRLLQHLKTFGSKTQFGMVGCQEAQHTLKKALHLSCQQGLETYALFVDLVKAFDTVQHPLLFDILKKYGIPDALIKVVKKMYNNCTVSCKLGNKTININYNTGVQQGDNASPILFAYIMQAFLDTLKTNVKASEFRFFQPPKNGNLKASNGRLIGQPTSSKGTPFSFNNVFFVDDSVFITDNRAELETLTPILVQHFQRLGMQMHVGENNTKSKTEAMYFPNSLKKAKELTTERSLPPDLILPNNKKVQFTHVFKYLGFTITTKLNEDTKVKIRINKAKSILGAMKHFFNNKDVDLRTKHSVYTSFAINAALWGCESWSLSTRNKK
jgi:hypothetical protein